MTTLLIVTSSIDETCDSIALLLNERSLPFFRWNIDFWSRYSIDLDEESFFISDPIGRQIDVNCDDVMLLWRKPFIDQMVFDQLTLGDDDQVQARSQMSQWLQALVAVMKPARRVRLIEPYADRRLPKLYQLRVASKFFQVPQWHFDVKASPKTFGPMLVTKPLGDPLVGSQNIFYSSYVDCNELARPYPWFVQEALIGGEDVTCVYIHGNTHFFVCDFVRGSSAIDWRVEINTESQSRWRELTHPSLAGWRGSVERYMRSIGLHYGRLDFILRDGVLYFLECNSNGQFGWLDDPSSLNLHREFLEAALDPATTVIR